MGAPGLGWDSGSSVHSQFEPFQGYWCRFSAICCCCALCWIRDWNWIRDWLPLESDFGDPWDSRVFWDSGSSGCPGSWPASRALSIPIIWILMDPVPVPWEAPHGHIPAHPSPPTGRGTGPWNVPSPGRDHAWGRPLTSPILARWDPGRCQHPSQLLMALPSSRGLGFTGSHWSYWGCCSSSSSLSSAVGRSLEGWDLDLPELCWSSCCLFIHPNLPKRFPAPTAPAPATVHDWRA